MAIGVGEPTEITPAEVTPEEIAELQKYGNREDALNALMSEKDEIIRLGGIEKYRALVAEASKLPEKTTKARVFEKYKETLKKEAEEWKFGLGDIADSFFKRLGI